VVVVVVTRVQPQHQVLGDKSKATRSPPETEAAAVVVVVVWEAVVWAVVVTMVG
jgi:hypothetical protein